MGRFGRCIVKVFLGGAFIGGLTGAVYIANRQAHTGTESAAYAVGATVTDAMTETVEITTAAVMADDAEATGTDAGINVYCEELSAYWRVLNNEETFVSTNHDNQVLYWNDFQAYQGEAADYKAGRFALVDLDQDGSAELALECCMPETTQIFRYEEGVVYSFQFPLRGMKRIQENGIYNGSSGAANSSYNRISFDKDRYTETVLAELDGYDDCGRPKCYINGQQVFESTFQDYADETLYAEIVCMHDFTEANLRLELLEGGIAAKACEEYCRVLNGTSQLTDVRSFLDDDEVSFALCRLNYSGAWELVVRSERCLYVFEYQDDGKMHLLFDGGDCTWYSLLDNGMIRYCRPSAAPVGEYYMYYYLANRDCFKRCAEFARYDDNQNGIFDEDDRYLIYETIDGKQQETEVSMEVWEEKIGHKDASSGWTHRGIEYYDLTDENIERLLLGNFN